MLGKNIKKSRLKQDISIYYLANLAKVDGRTLSRIESEKIKDPRVSTIIKIAKALNIDINELIKDYK